jgi:hypothetical protein
VGDPADPPVALIGEPGDCVGTDTLEVPPGDAPAVINKLSEGVTGNT